MKTLDKTERRFLLSKYMKNPEEPLNFDESLKKVNYFHNQLKELRDKLRKKGKSDLDIQKEFKKKFEKLCQEIS